MRHTLLIIVMLVFAGCTNPINRNTATRYAEHADQEASLGNWFNARMGYGRAIKNGEIGGLNEGNMAYLWFQYGRTSGIICDWSEAVRGFEESYKIDTENGETTYDTLYEFGEMYLVRKDYEKAVRLFENAYLKMNADKVRETKPVRYALFLENYSKALFHTKSHSRYKEVKKESDIIFKANPGKEKKIRRTPYGSQC